LFLLEAEDKDPQADKWCVYKYPAIATVDEKYRRKGEALHPERFPVSELEKTRASFYSQGLSRWWNSLYQQNPVEEEGNFFKNDWIRYYTKLPDEQLNWYIGVDYAVSKATSADHTAIIRFGVDKDLNIYIDPQIFHERCSSLEAVNAVLRMAKEKSVFQIGSEKGVIENAIGPLWEQRCRELKQFPFVNKLARSQGKHIYASTLQGRMQQGKIFFPKTKLVDEVLVPELLAFRADADNKSDNLVDAMTNGLMMLDTVLPPPRAKTSVADPDIVPGSYEDLMARTPKNPANKRPEVPKSLHSWHREAKKKSRFW
jgi:phage terminase large subunit-like protein